MSFENEIFKVPIKDILLENFSVYKLFEKQNFFFEQPFFPEKITIELWIISILAAIAIGMTGLIPLVFIPFTVKCLNNSNKLLRLMLSFSVGALLGDVFLHLLPEAWNLFSKTSNFKNDTYFNLGYWVLFGMATFICIQLALTINDNCKVKEKKSEKFANIKSDKNIIVAYLNLLANAIDNFSHGLAVGASYIVGYKIGFLTTIAIIIHEVPHEFADFAILLRSGINKWKAIKVQILTASIGIFGTISALLFENYKIDGECSITTCLLPFTAGAFLYIALTNILSEIIKEENAIESVKQFICIILGVSIMGSVNYFVN